MKNKTANTPDKTQEITRKDAIKKIGNYGKYAALTAIGTYFILSPVKAQTVSNVTNQAGGVLGTGGGASEEDTDF
jgi:hypothetical protein